MSNVGWTVSSDQSWLTVGGIGWGIDSSTIKLTATANTDVSPRTATVTVYGNGVTAQTITVSQAGTGSGINEISGNTFRLYPNPSNGYIVVRRDIARPEKLLITNSLGQVVFSKILESGNETISLSQLQSGVYIVDLNGRKVKLIVK